MAIWRIPILLALCLAAVPAVPGEDDFAGIQSRISEFNLPNGMNFIVLERHQAPVASFLTYADVGSAQEVKGITGLAHIFEHMAFKGSPNIGTKNYAEEKRALDRVDQAFRALQAEKGKGDEADKEKLKQLESDFKAAQEGAGKFVVKDEFGDTITRAGGRGLDASTAWDWTIYYFALPSNSMELWFYLESERFLHPVLREFYKERDVVMEERRMRTESMPIGKLLEEFLAAAYIAHPYGEPVVGHMSDLENVTRADGEAFFRRYYSPSNLTSVIVGDVDPKRVRQLAEGYFGRIPSGPKPEPIRTVEPPQIGERRVSLRLQAQRVVVVGYHKPGLNHPDAAVYDAIGSLLSEGRSSRLHRGLVRDRKVAVQAGGFSGLPGNKYPGLFIFAAFTAPGKTNGDVEKAFEEEIDKLKTQLVNKAELEGVKRRARAELIRQLGDNFAMCRQLASWKVITGDWRNLFRYLDKINAVTPEEIQRVAKATFTQTNRTVGTIEPLEAASAK
jgi:predicted Zn-dependent peptidase